jgi:hypothetical protein
MCVCIQYSGILSKKTAFEHFFYSSINSEFDLSLTLQSIMICLPFGGGNNFWEFSCSIECKGQISVPFSLCLFASFFFLLNHYLHLLTCVYIPCPPPFSGPLFASYAAEMWHMTLWEELAVVRYLSVGVLFIFWDMKHTKFHLSIVTECVGLALFDCFPGWQNKIDQAIFYKCLSLLCSHLSLYNKSLKRFLPIT